MTEKNVERQLPLIGGEGIIRTRPCCPEGLQFDLDHGLTLIGGRWVNIDQKETAANA